MSDRRYPFAAVEAFMACPPADAFEDGLPRTNALLAERIGVTRRTIARWRGQGLSIIQADRVATALHRHPMELWPTWLEDRLAEAEVAEQERLERRRAAARRYAAKRRRDPAVRARDAAYMRAYRASPRAREIDRQRSARWYRENRERALQRQRDYDRTVRAERRRQARDAAA